MSRRERGREVSRREGGNGGREGGRGMWEEGESEVSKREGEREEGLLKRRMVKEYHIIVHT